MDRKNLWIVLTVGINGHAVRARLDSGAIVSVLDRADAVRAGVVAQARGASGGEPGLSVAAGSLAAVQRLTVGELTLKDMSIEVADLAKRERYIAPGSTVLQNFERTPMLLGADFLRAHRVLVAHSQMKLYITYLGGAARKDADAAGRSGDADRAVTQ